MRRWASNTQPTGRTSKGEKSVKKHYDSWVDFARAHGHDSNHKPAPVLGVDLTQELAMVAHSHSSLRMECEFLAAVPVVTSAFFPCGESDTLKSCYGPGPRTIEAAPSPDSGGHATPGSTIPGGWNQYAFIWTKQRKSVVPPTSIRISACNNRTPAW